jgi:hypothetical protein
VDHYLPYFRLWLITLPLLALLPFQPLFTESSQGDQILPFPLFAGALSATLPLCCVLVFSSLFIVQFFFFLQEGGHCAQGAMLVCYFISGVARGTLHDAWCSPVWYTECLSSRFGAGVWRRWELSCFLSATQHGEAFHN